MPLVPSAVTSALLMLARQAASSTHTSRVSQPSGGTHEAGSASRKLKGRKRTVSADHYDGASGQVNTAWPSGWSNLPRQRFIVCS